MNLLAPVDWELTVPSKTMVQLFKQTEMSCFFCGDKFTAKTLSDRRHELCKPCSESHYE